MTDQAVLEEIRKTLVAVVDASSKGDYEAYANLHTEDVTVMGPDCMTISGREALKNDARSVIRSKNIATIVLDEIIYFEMLNANTAYVNALFNCVNQSEQIVAKLRFTLIMKKMDKQWYIERKHRNCPELTPKEIALNEIRGNFVRFYDALSRKDIESALAMYAEEPTFFFPGEGTINGKKDGLLLFKKIVPSMKTLVLDEIFYFDLFGEDTSITNDNVNLVDESGKVYGRLRCFILWKKEGGTWKISRDSFNNVPLE